MNRFESELKSHRDLSKSELGSRHRSRRRSRSGAVESNYERETAHGACRKLFASQIEDGRKWDSSGLSRLSGDDTVAVRNSSPR